MTTPTDTSAGPSAATPTGTSDGAEVVVASGGDASDEEVAAIVAAIEVAWPRRPVAAAGDASPPRWRFSGRWWTKPVPLRRNRPW